MTITYKEMREKALTIQAEKDKRVEFIKSSVEKLVSDYIESLGLENELWTDLDGRNIDYVRMGMASEGGYRFYIDDITTHHTQLAIFTVVNDDPRGGDEAKCVISLESDKFAESLVVKIHNNPIKQFTVVNGDFTDVCDAIKDSTYANISKLNDFE